MHQFSIIITGTPQIGSRNCVVEYKTLIICSLAIVYSTYDPPFTISSKIGCYLWWKMKIPLHKGYVQLPTGTSIQKATPQWLFTDKILLVPNNNNSGHYNVNSTYAGLHSTIFTPISSRWVGNLPSNIPPSHSTVRIIPAIWGSHSPI